MADQTESQPSAAEETSVDDGSKSAPAAAMGEAGKSSQDDPELNELLNSALEDFDKVKLSEESETASTNNTATPQSDAGAAGGKPQGAEADPLSEDFSEMFSEQFASQFEETMASLMSQNPQVMQQFEKLAQAAETAGDSQEAQQNFMETLTQTLVDMSENADGIQEETLEDQDQGQGQAEGQGDDFMPMMQELMQTLLSKNVLYPSLKEISSKYPTYLSENEGKIEASDLDLYRRQYEVMTAICSVYEEEKADDSAEVKSQRFEKLLDLMQQMQELGQPPKDIVGDMAPGLEFDENGMPRLPGMSGSQCRLM